MNVGRKFSVAVVAAGALLGAVVSMASGKASAQSIADVANYRGPDRQAKLEAGARKEGAVLSYAVATQTEPIYEAFRKKYPFLKVELYRNGGQEVTRKVIEEYRAGRHGVDVFAITLDGLIAMRDQGLLQPFHSPEMAHFRADAIESGRHWTIIHESYNGLGWNTKAYNESEVPKTYDDLLDPKWKGKFSVSARSSTFVQWVGVAVIEKGVDYVRKLGKQDFVLHQISGRALANMVVSGEVPISPAIFSAHMRESQGEGASVAWRALGPVFANNISLAMPIKAGHPHAAMLFIDFKMSKEGQKMRMDLGYASPRLDMPTIEKPDKVYQLPMRPNYADEYEGWNKLIKDVFQAKR